MQSPTPDKSYKKTFEKKEDNLNKSESQPSQNSTNWQPGVKPGWRSLKKKEETEMTDP